MLSSYLPCTHGQNLDDKLLAVWLLVHVRSRGLQSVPFLPVGYLWQKDVIVPKGAQVISQPVSLGAGLWPSPARAGEGALHSWTVGYKNRITPGNTARKAILSGSNNRHKCLINFQMYTDTKSCCVFVFCSCMMWNSLSPVTLPPDAVFLSVKGKAFLWILFNGRLKMAGEIK